MPFNRNTATPSAFNSLPMAGAAAPSASNTHVVPELDAVVLKAIAPIAAGDEVTHDYSTLLGGDDVWTMRCNCGEANCRRTVRNIGKLPAATVRHYRRLGIIPDFIYATRNLKI